MMDEHRNYACCFSGHRNIPSKQRTAIRNQLHTTVEQCIQNGYRFFYTGGALGFDTMAAQVVLEHKKQFPYIRLILMLPCRTQADGWKKIDVDEYERIKSLADEVIYTAEEYKKGCMHKRNRFLVDNSSMCICYLTKAVGGTAYTVQYAERKGVCIVNIANTLKTDLR